MGRTHSAPDVQPRQFNGRSGRLGTPIRRDAMVKGNPMRSFVVTAAPARQKSDCVIVGLADDGAFAGAGALVDAALSGRLSRLVKRGDLRGKSGESKLLDVEDAPFQ